MRMRASISASSYADTESTAIMENRFSHLRERVTQPVPNSEMQRYMERQLTELHYTSVGFNFRQKFIAFWAGALIIILLPFIHIGVFYRLIWVPDKPPIDKAGCTCSCFDTVFRGRYEMPGEVTYKHIYFNATKETFQVWVFTVLFILMFYESVKYIVYLVRMEEGLRRSMVFLYLINLYPHYYSWWSFFSYYNEELYTYFWHHMFFTVTEIIASVIVLNLMNVKSEVSSWKVLGIVTINLMHVLVACSDQFIAHVVHRRGQTFQNVRNIALMIPDLFHVIIPPILFIRTMRQKGVKLTDMVYKEEIIMCVVLSTFGTIMGRLF